MIKLISRLLRKRLAFLLALSMHAAHVDAQTFIRHMPDTCKLLVVTEQQDGWSKCRTVVVPIPRNYSFTIAGNDTTWTWSGWTRTEKRKMQTQVVVRTSPNCPTMYTEEYLIRSCQ